MYIAPELLAGKPASTRSDIYSLGVVVYQLLSGDFTRPVTTDWARHVPDSLLRDDLGRCFAGDPNEWFGSAAELAKNLRAWEQRKAEVARRQAEQAERERLRQAEEAECERLRQQAEHRHRLSVAAAGVALVLAAIAFALGYGLNRAEKQRRLAEAYLYDADMNLAQQALEVNNLGRARRLLDRHCLSGSDVLNRRCSIQCLDLPTGKEVWQTPEQQDAGLTALAVSPDGRILASVNEPVSRTVFAAGGRVLVVATIAQGYNHEITFYDLTHPNRTPRRASGRHLPFRLMVAPSGGLVALSTEGGLVRLFKAKGEWIQDLHGNLNVVSGLAFSADGRRLISAYGGREAVKIWDVATGQELLTLAGAGSLLTQVRWIADGDMILTGAPPVARRTAFRVDSGREKPRQW